MIVASLLLIGAAIVLLVLGLWQPSSVLLTGSIGASVLAAVLLVIGARRSAGDRPHLGRHAEHTRQGSAEPHPGASTDGDAPDEGDDSGPYGRWDREAAPTGPPPSTAHFPTQQLAADQLRAGRGAATGSDHPDGEGVTGGASESAPTMGGEPEVATRDTAPLHVDGVSDRSPTAAAASGAPAGPDGGGAAQAVEAHQRAVTMTIPHQGARDAAPVGVAESGGDGDEADPPDEPAAQQVSAADAARVGRMSTEVLVVDGRPRYHLPGCVHLLGRESEPLPVNEAIELGFTPCSLCEPDSALLADARRV